jgi:hypothetical protein
LKKLPATISATGKRVDQKQSGNSEASCSLAFFNLERKVVRLMPMMSAMALSVSPF